MKVEFNSLHLKHETVLPICNMTSHRYGNINFENLCMYEKKQVCIMFH